jgi:hypothetical protein
VVSSLSRVSKLFVARQGTHPEPVVLKVCSIGRIGNVDVSMRCVALRVLRKLRALRYLLQRAFGSSNTRMDIPNSRTTCAVQIIFDELGSRRWALSLHNHVRPLDASALTGSANLDNGPRIALIRPEVPRAHDGREALSNHTGTGRDIDCLSDSVHAVFEEEDLVLRSRLENGVLYSCCIISTPVTRSARAASTDKVAGVNVLVCGLRLRVVFA